MKKIKMIKSPLRYPGGKESVIGLILNEIPEYKEYREPFLGGGSLFLRMKQLYPNKSYWINDLFYELYKFWFEVQTDVDELIFKLNKMKENLEHGRDLFYEIKRGELEDVNIGASFFYMNKTSFSGLTFAGGYSEWAKNVCFVEKQFNKLVDVSNLLKNVKLTNLDYKNILNECGDDVFIFLDPPYYSNKKSALYGRDGKLHTEFDHYEFAESLKNCKHKWLVTIDDHSDIREMFKWANIISFDIKYCINQPKKINELIIKNY